MARSRVALALVAAFAGCALACDALLGLGGYQEVDCIPLDCGQETGGQVESGPDVFEGGMETTFPDGPEGGVTADADADAGDTSFVFEGSVDGPALTELWARWFMPNPDASSAPTIDGSPALPNPMAYDAGADAATAFDLVTKLTWARASASANDFGKAATTCASMGQGWHVPTRIQLVSLIDFTQPVGNATIDPATFPSTPAALFWTSSQVPLDAATPLYWLVDFGTGLVSQRTSANYVLCVKDVP
jgi:hypothetical protein